jgi:hypothetical protein
LVVAAVFNRSDDEILASPIQAALVELEKCSIYYTTNYDNFIERALNKRGRPCQIVTAEHTMSHEAWLKS